MLVLGEAIGEIIFSLYVSKYGFALREPPSL